MKLDKNENILKIQDLHRYFGGVKALKGITIEIPRKKIIGLIGPNGSGKTTLFNVITGLYKPTKGIILLNGKDISQKRIDLIAKMGVGRTFQNLQLLDDLSVLENIMVGSFRLISDETLLDVLFNTNKYRRIEKDTYSKAEEIVQFVDLYKKKNELIKNLSYGERKRVEFARAIATDPQLLLLDEPVAGMNQQEILFFLDLIKKLSDSKEISILLIEHHVGFVAFLSSHIIVLDQGTKIAEGTPNEVQENQLVIEAYLGKGEENVF